MARVYVVAFPDSYWPGKNDEDLKKYLDEYVKVVATTALARDVPTFVSDCYQDQIPVSETPTITANEMSINKEYWFTYKGKRRRATYVRSVQAANGTTFYTCVEHEADGVVAPSSLPKSFNPTLMTDIQEA